MGLFLDGANSKIYNDVWHNVKTLGSTSVLTPTLSPYSHFIAIGSAFSLHSDWAGGKVAEINLSHDSISANDFDINFNTNTSTITLVFLRDIQLAPLISGLTFTIKFKENNILGYLTIKFSSQGGLDNTSGQYKYGVTFSFTQGASGTKTIDLGDSIIYSSLPTKISKSINESNVTEFMVDTAKVKGYIKGMNFEGTGSNTTFQGSTYSNGVLKFGDTFNLLMVEANITFASQQFLLTNFQVVGGGQATVFQLRLDDVPIIYKYGYSASTNAWNILNYYNVYEDKPIWFNNDTKINGFLTVVGEVK